MKCPDCFGVGILDTDETPPCKRCEATGNVPKQMRQWMIRGRSLADVRRRRKSTPQGLAEALGLDISVIVNTEAGMIDPPYDEIDITNAFPSKMMTAIERIAELEKGSALELS